MLSLVAAAFVAALPQGQVERCVSVEPADVAGVRLLREPPVGPLLLDFLAVKRDTEDRTLIEIDLSALPAPSRVSLEMGIEDIDPDDEVEGVIDVFVYAGDGQVTPEDFFSGTTLFTSFVWDDGPGVVSVDLTAAVEAARAAGWSTLGLRLSGATSDRYWLGAAVGRPPDPLLTACSLETPEDIIDELDAMAAGFPALANQLAQARARLATAEAALEAGRSRQAGNAFCQARGKLATFVTVAAAKAAGDVDRMRALAELAQDLIDERLRAAGLAGC